MNDLASLPDPYDCLPDVDSNTTNFEAKNTYNETTIHGSVLQETDTKSKTKDVHNETTINGTVLQEVNEKSGQLDTEQVIKNDRTDCLRTSKDYINERHPNLGNFHMNAPSHQCDLLPFFTR